MTSSINDLIKHLRCLGLQEGDTVLVRASVRKIGDVLDDNKRSNASEKFIHALLSVVGNEGTIVALSFTKAFLFPKKNKDYIYSSVTEPITGGFASAMVNWPGSMRSNHPSNSFVAIGKHANDIIKDHGEKATCFHPMAKLIDHDGKMLLVGCVSESPGFSTVHLAQDHLGLSVKSLFSNKLGVYYRDKDGRVKLFKKKDIPGCSMGFYKFYSYYVKEGMLRTGWVGQAYSVSIKAKAAYEIERELLSTDPKIALCDDPACESCRGSLYYNLSDWPAFYFRYTFQIINKIFSARNRSKHVAP